jgi:hypothetical protein
VYDNSGLQGPRIVAQMNDGFCIGCRPGRRGRLTPCGRAAELNPVRRLPTGTAQRETKPLPPIRGQLPDTV